MSVAVNCPLAPTVVTSPVARAIFRRVESRRNVTTTVVPCTTDDGSTDTRIGVGGSATGSWKKSRQKENQIGCISTTDALEQRCHKKKVGSPQRALDGILWSWPAAGKVNWSRNKLASEKAILRNLRSRNSRRAK